MRDARRAECSSKDEVVTKGKPAVPLDTKTRVVYLFNRVVRCIEELVAQAGEFDAFRCGCEEATKALQQAAEGLRNLGGPANHGRSSVLLRVNTKSFIERGADIAYLSAFPSEKEVLFPVCALRPTPSTTPLPCPARCP